ncbi:aldo/keto reductase [Streptomyces spiramenti]|uniref:Aldo/keto reductase n=1 Tax=Streptomyces spiramenti TaxID=2720606 RepID=A0ABX1AEM1_9ACTN|nr:aldo/keto reductase [Streptomyces spiramenti]NJP65618.1 aldo/keto reductase [Streptomyces spiramenti]
MTTPRHPAHHETAPGPDSLVLGTMHFGTTVPEADAHALLDRFVERGGRWIDTADCYAFWQGESGRGGHSELVLGRWLAARPGMRERVLLATKTGAEPAVPGVAEGSRTGLSARAIGAAAQASLRRLGVGTVDLFWAHMEDRATDLTETVDALAELTDSGRALRVGASNHPAWRVERARGLAVSRGSRPLDAIQLSHSYLRPRPGALTTEHSFGDLSGEQLDHAAVNGMDIWAYTPLLRGAYDVPERALPPAYHHPGTTDRLAALAAVSGELGLTAGQVVLAWLAGGAVPVLPILGASRLWQLDAALDAVTTPLPLELRRRLDEAGTVRGE